MTSTHRIAALDQEFSTRLAIPPEARWLRLLALCVAHSGDSPLWIVGAGILILWAPPPGRDVGWRILVGTLAAGAATTALKWSFRRPRPPGKGWGFYTRFDRHAFPSGHAGRTACVAALLVPFVPAPCGPPALLLWVALVGLARVVLRVHFITDILGGWGLGWVIGWMLHWIL
jgi:undecaprenyl-diphosphatase